MFKYQSFNDFSRKNLLKSSLYFNKHDYFNDPFECCPIERTGYPDPIRERDRFLSVIKSWGFSVNMAKDALDSYKIYVDELEDWPEIISSKKKSARISCFGAEDNNLLMWSHYADGLRGFCIEFDDSVFDGMEPEKYPIELHFVKYRSSPSSVDTVAYSIANDMFWHCEDADEGLKALYDLDTKTLATKPAQWAYESEIRAITHIQCEKDEGILIPYSSLLIKRVIIGEKASQVDINFIYQTFSQLNPDVSIEVASKVKDKYEISIEKRPRKAAL